jgi:tetratricopeptide (TPR) repeat protein
MSLKRTSTAAGLPDRVIDDAPYCWLCLEEGELGKPLVRNCSCRGSSGFAHLSCAIKYAENKSRELYESEECAECCEDFFMVCPNCKQNYQGDVEYAMAKAQVEFIEREYKNDLVLYLDALVDTLYSLLDFKDEQNRQDGEEICSKMLSIIEKVDKSPTLQYDELTHSMAIAHNSMGEFRSEFGSKENLEKAKKHFERSIDLYEVIGDELGMMTMERIISIVEAELRGNRENELDTTQEMNYFRKSYDDCIERHGENGISTIHEGIQLARALHEADHTIEAERFLTKLLANSRRVHGIEHNITEKTLAALKEVKMRQVFLTTEQDFFQALRYENDGRKIVVQGPLPELLDERNVDEEKILIVSSKDVTPAEGTPVVCYGLQLCGMMSHLNEKIGDIRAVDEDNIICKIHFEKEGLKPTEVRLENVRILFDLPEK